MAGIGSGREGGGARSPGFFFAAARGGGSPEFTNLGAPGVESARAWVWDEVRDTRNLPRALAEGCRVRSDGRSSGCGAAVTALTSVRVRATPGLGTGVKWVGVLARG